MFLTEGVKDLSQIEWAMTFPDYKSIYTQVPRSGSPAREVWSLHSRDDEERVELEKV